MKFFSLEKIKGEHTWRTLFFHSSWSLTLTAGFSYFLGLVRDKVLASEFGLSRSLDIYNASFVIPDMILSVLIGTALSAAFVPIFSKHYDINKEQAYKYAHQIISWGITIVIGTAVFVGIFLPYFTHLLVPGFEGEDLKTYILLTRMLLLSPIIFTLSSAFGRILISVKEFFWWGLSPALYNLGIILGALLLAPYFGIMGVVIGTLIGALFHMVNRFWPIKKKKYGFYYRIDYSVSDDIKETVKLALPKIFQYGMWAIMLMSFTSIASQLAEGSVAVYNYARNFQSLPVSLLGIAIALATYPTLSHDAGKGNFKKFKKDFKFNRKRSAIYTSLAALALALISRPLIQILLGGGEFGCDDILLLSSVLTVYCLSIPLESMMQIYHRAFYSLRNSFIPSILHGANIILTIYLAKTLTSVIDIFAIPIGFAVGLAVHITLLSIIFPFLLRKRELKFDKNI